MIETIYLENGLCVVMEQLDYIKSASYGIWVRSGARHESKENSGISHFIEHMCFKGTKKRSAKDIAAQFDEIGGMVNAYTSKELTCYHARSLTEHVMKGLEILSDMVLYSTFDKEMIENERKIILEEIDMYEDSPEDLVGQNAALQIWGDTGLGRPVIGTKESVSSFTQKQIIDYKNSHYTSDRIVISISGMFDKNEVLSFIKNTFSALKKAPAPLEYDSAKHKSSIQVCKKNIEQTHIVLSFKGVSFEDEKNAYPSGIFSMILGSGMSSRLFQAVREDSGLCYSIYSYSMRQEGAGMFGIYLATNPKTAIEAIKLVIEQLKLIKTEQVSENELLRAREQVKSSFVMGFESSAYRMEYIGRNQLLRGKIKDTEQIVKEITGITTQDIKLIANEILDFSNMSIAVVGKDIDEKMLEKILNGAKNG